jgi:hypothetical protein
VRSSSALVIRLKPTTSAARIAAIFRASRFAHRAPSSRRILSQKTSASAAESRIGAPPSVYGFDVYLRAYPRRLDRRRGSQQGLLNGAGEPAAPRPMRAAKGSWKCNNSLWIVTRFSLEVAS